MSIRDALDARGMRAADPWQAVLDRLTDGAPLYSAPDPEGFALRPVQRAALGAIARVGGLLGLIGVGHGKTLIGFLAPDALLQFEHASRVRGRREYRVLYLVPANMRAHTLREWRRYAEIFGDVPAQRRLASYAEISRDPELLAAWQPDAIVADEAHKLRNPAAGRTNRVRAYLRDRPETRFVAMSGTITNRSTTEYAHLAEWALGGASPFPADSGARAALAQGVSVGTEIEPWAHGRLRALGQPYRRRWFEVLRRTPGVVLTSAQSCDASLSVQWVAPPADPEVDELHRLIDREWALPDGRLLVSPAEVAAAHRAADLGIWYRWIWPSSWSADRIRAYRRSVSAWSSAVRSYLGRRGGAEIGYDTCGLLLAAALRGDAPTPEIAEAAGPYDARGEGPTVAREVASPDRLRAIGDLATEHACPLVWHTTRDAFGASDHGRWSARFLSIAQHGTGTDGLQVHSRALVAQVPPNGSTLEQLFGRLHRIGQTADTVEHLLLDTKTNRGAWFKAQRDALYLEQTTGQPQKIRLAATVENNPEAG